MSGSDKLLVSPSHFGQRADATWSRGSWISVAISTIALVAAMLIGIPAALRETGQRRVTSTMVDMRSIATVLESYARDHGGYPSLPHLSVSEQHSNTRKADQWAPPAAWPVQIEQRLDGLGKILRPRYADRLPVTDRWGYPFLYATTKDRQKYTIVSTGSDGKLASMHTDIWYFPDADRDLVYADGAFLERPEGT